MSKSRTNRTRQVDRSKRAAPTRRARNTTHTCRGKTRFRDQDEATQAMHRIQGKGDQRQKTPQRVYECPDCRGWHLTSRLWDSKM